MGEVYRAEQVSLKRPVAVKRIAEHLIDDPDVVARFEREAQCIAKVSSQNVLAVYEFGRYTDDEDDDHWLLVMELVEGGGSAKQYMQQAMHWRHATSIVLQVAEGLAVAAEDSIIHRDIKPDNIMLTKKGVAKLADFGLAKASDSMGMTMEGSLLGTPYYMPPEACRGEATDHRGDIYSLGATWYHLLAGRPPFEANNTMMLLRAHCEEEPTPIQQLAPKVPEPVATLMHRCLAKEPDQRPVSAQQLAREIHALVAQKCDVPRTVPDLMQGSGEYKKPDETTVDTLINGSGAYEKTQANASAQDLTIQADATAQGAAGLAATQRKAAPAPTPAPAAKKSSASLVIGVVAVLGLAGAGVAAWQMGLFASQPVPNPDPITRLDPDPQPVDPDPQPPADPDPQPPADPDPQPPADPDPQPPADPDPQPPADPDPQPPADPDPQPPADPDPQPPADPDPQPPADPDPQPPADPDPQPPADPDPQPPADPDPKPEDPVKPPDPSDLTEREQWALALDNSQREYDLDHAVEAWAWLDRIPTDKVDGLGSSERTRYFRLRTQVKVLAERLSGEALQAVQAAAQNKDLDGALKLLQETRPLAVICGREQVHDQYIEQLRRLVNRE